MATCADQETQLQALTAAENRSLAARGVPPARLGVLPNESSAVGQGDFRNWELDLNRSSTGMGSAEERLDTANTVAHEGEHLGQWYDMARWQAGLESNPTRGPLTHVPADVALHAQLNPIRECSPETARVEEHYESVYGSGAQRRNQILGGYVEDPALQQTRPATQAEYCNLPEERDAWARGREVTQQMRAIEGLEAPPPEEDPSICDLDADAASPELAPWETL